MVDYNWTEIFQSKSNTELLKIYSGDTFLNFEQQIAAGSELIKRGFDKKRILDIANRISESYKTEYFRINDNYKFINMISLKTQALWFGIGCFIFGWIIMLVNNIRSHDLSVMLILIGPIAIISALIDLKQKIRKVKNQRKEDIEKISSSMDLLKMQIYDNLDKDSSGLKNNICT